MLVGLLPFSEQCMFFNHILQYGALKRYRKTEVMFHVQTFLICLQMRFSHQWRFTL